jgi:hypothetical protein
MIFGRRAAAILLTFLFAGVLSADVVVLKGGAVISLKSPPVRRGDTVLLTRTDGTLLSVPLSEIDREATASARAKEGPPAPAATSVPAATLAGAARAAREVPKARVRITDADVSHGEAAAAEAEGAAAEGEGDKEADSTTGAGRVEVADYSQEKSGDALVVRGTLRNPGATPAMNVRMTVTAIDSKGQTITSGEAGVSNGVIEPSRTVAFSVTIPVGSRPVGSLRFSPRWVAPPLPDSGSSPDTDAAARDRAAAAAAPGAAPAPTAAPKASAPPPPAPTPYGRGSLYAAPSANAPSQPPADGKTGYLPGASHPSNQPKPPN